MKGERYGKGRGKNRLKMCILEITLKVFYAPSQTICFINLWFVGHTQLSSEHIHDCFQGSLLAWSNISHMLPMMEPRLAMF